MAIKCVKYIYIYIHRKNKHFICVSVTWGAEYVQERAVRCELSCHYLILIKKQRKFNLPTVIDFLGYEKAFNEVIRNNLWHICLTNDFHIA
jgi:hypothetical protein